MNKKLPQQPIGWPTSYGTPDYYSTAGWELEKTITRNKLLHDWKDSHASSLIQRAGEMQEAALAALDEPLFFKYHYIAMRLIQYRRNLLKRYETAA